MSMTNKDFRARARIGTQLAVAAAAAALLSAPEVRAQTVYNVAGIADFTGPYADVMKDLAGCRKTVFDWWNEEESLSLSIIAGWKLFVERACRCRHAWRPPMKSPRPFDSRSSRPGRAVRIELEYEVNNGVLGTTR